MARSIRGLLAATGALSLFVVGSVVASQGVDGTGAKAQVKGAPTTGVSAKAQSKGCRGHASTKAGLVSDKAKGGGCGGNCQGHCGQGRKAGRTTSKNAGLASGKAKGAGCGGNCGGNCGGDCKGNCGSNGKGNCGGSCKGDCKGDCKGNCTGNCKDRCAHGTASAKASLTSTKADRQGGCHGIEDATRTIKITPTGVIIEITGENPAAIAALHARFAKMENVVKTASAKP